MTLRECYTALGGDLDEVLGRLRSERLVQKFVLKFLDDPSYALLQSSVAAGDYKEAFRAAHTLKGTCANLGFTRLSASSSALTEAMRGDVAPADSTLLSAVEADYQRVTDAIRAFQAELA